MDLHFSSWQEFEKFVKDVMEKFGYEVDFRKVFFSNGRRYEMDVVGYGKDFVLCIDCKLYGAGRHRISQLRREARKHYERVKEFEKIEGKISIPIIVTFWEEPLITEEGCMFVPITKINDFLRNVYFYLEEFGFMR
ncbi:MAG: hypothetical protein J7L45_00390 [Candidatus Aenigmarchaeota archaeon]|nr:hypothetical protein [Candidatus Aenigmarchaeota archaeon]